MPQTNILKRIVKNKSVLFHDLNAEKNVYVDKGHNSNKIVMHLVLKDG